jgi:hypothetical protein
MTRKHKPGSQRGNGPAQPMTREHKINMVLEAWAPPPEQLDKCRRDLEEQFDLAEAAQRKAAQREATQRDAAQRKAAERKADRDKQIKAALDLLAPLPDERERCRAHIEEVLDFVVSADRAAEHAVTKKALSDYRDVLVQFRARSKRAADAGLPLAFRLDAIDRAIDWLDHWSPPPSALKQRHAVALAYELATRWGMKTLVSRKGYGDREADLYRQKCRADLPAKERRFLAGALRAVAKRFEQIADKIDIDEPREMTSISPDAPGAAP